MATQLEQREQNSPSLVSPTSAAEVALEQLVPEIVRDAARDSDAYLHETQTPHGGE